MSNQQLRTHSAKKTTIPFKQSNLTRALIFLGCFSSQASWASVSHPTVTAQREQAVLIARSGRLDEAIDHLNQLHTQYPSDVSVVADLVVLLRQAGRNGDIQQLTQHQSIDTFPSYAVLPWISALRDLHLYTDAQRLLVDTHGKLGIKGQILYALISIEANQPQVALAALPKMGSTLDATDLAQMAYVYRLAKNPAQGLLFSQRARAQDANHTLAIRESVFALSDLHSAGAAYSLARQHAALFTTETLNQLQVDHTAAQLLDAIAERNRLDGLRRYAVRNQPLEAVLAEIDANLTTFPKDSPQFQQTEVDRIYVLRLLNRMPEAIAAYTHLSPNIPIPVYVKRAVADAYLANRQPKIAAHMYRELLLKQNDEPLYLSLYRALIDAEDYKQAAAVLTQLQQITPYYAHVRAYDGGRIPNWERLEVDQAVAMDAAYRNHLDVADRQFAALFNQAPYNAGIMDDYATVLRWRGWPQAADRMTAMATTSDPYDPTTRMNVANNASDLGQIPRWKQTILPLYQDFPNDTAVQKNYAAWQDRNRPSISSELTVGDSTGAGNTINLNGSRDRDWQTRINTPWMMDNWRGFVQHEDRWAEINPQEVQDNRLGAGVEWESERRDGWVLFSQRFPQDDHSGASAGWSQWLNDYWQYGFNGSTDSIAIPLRALDAGLSARDANFNLKWRQDESRSAYLNLGLLNIDDGNHRQMVSLGGSQRLLTGDYYITTGGIDFYHETNSQAGGVYYNPKNLFSGDIRVQHDWITWRDYDQSLTQNFQIATGLTDEAGYTTAPTLDLSYQHTWQLNRVWRLHYGVAWGTHVYSGDRERRISGLLGLDGVF